MTKQEFLDWFFEHKPYWPTPPECYDKLFPAAQPVEGEKGDAQQEIKERDAAFENLIAAQERADKLYEAHIVTPLKQEIERLKGLIESYYISYECQKHLRADIKLTDTQCEEMYQQFKTDNNL